MRLYIGNNKISSTFLGVLKGTFAVSSYTPRRESSVLGTAVIAEMKLGR